MEELSCSLEMLAVLFEGDMHLSHELDELLATVRSLAAGGSHSTEQGDALVLRSVEDCERRCGGLKEDLLVQAEANEELVKTLEFCKDTNRRLQGQLHSQTETLSRLSQQVSRDEECLEDVAQRLLQQQQCHDDDAGLTWTTQSADEALRQRLEQRSRELRHRVQQLHSEVLLLQREQRELLQVATAPQAFVAGVERDLLDAVKGHVQRQAAARAAMEPERREQEAAMAAVVARRREDSTHWVQQHAALDACNSDLQSQSERDMTCLSAQRSALERALAAERCLAEEESAASDRRLEQARDERRELQDDLERLERDVGRLRASDTANSAAIREKDQALRDLSRQVRESSDALAAALLSKQHLEQQLLEVRGRAHDERDAAVEACRTRGRQKSAVAGAEHDGDMEMRGRLVSAVREAAAVRSEELAVLQARAVELQRESAAASVELAKSKAGFEAECAARQRLEDEMQQQRKALSRRRLELFASIDDLCAANEATEAVLKEMAQRCAELRRSVQDEELRQVSEESSRADALKELLRQLEERTSKLGNLEMALAGEQRQLDHEARAAAGGREAWYPDLQREQRWLSDEVRRAEEQLLVHARAVTKGTELLQQRRASRSASLRQARDEVEASVLPLRQAVLRARDENSTEASRSRLASARQEEQISRLERDLVVLRDKLSHRRERLAEARAEHSREASLVDRVRGRLEVELARTSESLDEALCDASGDAAAGQRATREVLRLRDGCEWLRSEVDARLQQARREHEAKAGELQRRHRETVAACRARLSAVAVQRAQLASADESVLSLQSRAAASPSLARSASLALLAA